MRRSKMIRLLALVPVSLAPMGALLAGCQESVGTATGIQPLLDPNTQTTAKDRELALLQHRAEALFRRIEANRVIDAKTTGLMRRLDADIEAWRTLYNSTEIEIVPLVREEDIAEDVRLYAARAKPVIVDGDNGDCHCILGYFTGCQLYILYDDQCELGGCAYKCYSWFCRSGGLVG